MLPHQASIHWNARNWYPKRNGCAQTREEGLYCRNCAYMRWFSSGFVLFPGSPQVQLSFDNGWWLCWWFVGEEGGTEGLHCSCFPILAMHPWLARLHNNPYVESSREYSFSLPVPDSEPDTLQFNTIQSQSFRANTGTPNHGKYVSKSNMWGKMRKKTILILRLSEGLTWLFH